MKWGLIPFWAKDPKIGARMINARAETVAEKPAFRNALKETSLPGPRRRLLRMAENPHGQATLRIFMKSGEPFAMAGLWETWRDPQGNVVPSCTIITTAANDYIAPIHNRMPVILPRESEELWLDPGIEDPAPLTHMLAPTPDDYLYAYEVSTMVNYARNNGPEVIARVR